MINPLPYDNMIFYTMEKFKLYFSVYYLWQFQELKKENGQKKENEMTMVPGEKRGAMLERKGKVNNFNQINDNSPINWRYTRAISTILVDQFGAVIWVSYISLSLNCNYLTSFQY